MFHNRLVAKDRIPSRSAQSQSRPFGPQHQSGTMTFLFPPCSINALDVGSRLLGGVEPCLTTHTRTHKEPRRPRRRIELAFEREGRCRSVGTRELLLQGPCRDARCVRTRVRWTWWAAGPHEAESSSPTWRRVCSYVKRGPELLFRCALMYKAIVRPSALLPNVESPSQNDGPLSRVLGGCKSPTSTYNGSSTSEHLCVRRASLATMASGSTYELLHLSLRAPSPSPTLSPAVLKEIVSRPIHGCSSTRPDDTLLISD